MKNRSLCFGYDFRSRCSPFKMAAIVRVKRSRVEEPADTLFMLCKRSKLEGTVEDEEVKSVFKFAGTVNAKVF